MKITKKDLENSIANLAVKVETITGKPVNYGLTMGDARLGNVYSIRLEDGSTLCSFMVARELDAYIWGMYKAFDILNGR